MKKLISLIVLGLLICFYANAKNSNATAQLVFEKNITMHSHFYFDFPIKKLKRKLLRNLNADNLIESKKEFVKIELPKGKIIVNGKSLEGKLYTKYESIIQNYEIGHGEKRRIEMSPSFIKVGDFYEECFKGQASGRMKISICGNDKKKKSLF